MASSELLKAIAVTAELMGATLSPMAAKVFADDLAGYPEPAVLDSLARCRREVKGRLTVAEVVSRIDDGRPGPEEAWAMVPRDESQTVVWTDEMAHAFGIAGPLLADGDPIAARMAFKEAYLSAINKARNERLPAHWFASLGFDAQGRGAPIREAVRLGRLPLRQVEHLLPAPPVDPAIAKLITPMLEDLT
jgi:hypothetical protein